MTQRQTTIYGYIILFVLVFLGGVCGYFLRVWQDSKYTMVTEITGSNPTKFEYFKDQDGLNCVKTWEVSSQLCSVYKVKGVQNGR